jgi:Zn-dependent protease with chaperone function
VSLASFYRHPFITYTFVLSVALAALLGIWLRLSGGRAKVNPWLFIIPLEVPVLSYIINYSRILGWVGPLSFLWLGFSIAFYWLRWYRSGRLIRGFSSLSVENPRVQAALSRLCSDLGVRPPELCVMENSAPVLLTTGVFKKKVVLSTGALDLLDGAELDASLAHELAHMRRGGHGLKWLFLLVRDVTMFSPASLWAYAGFYQEEEKACDDWAASRTSLGISLASSLVKFMKHGRKNTFTALMSHFLPDRNIGATRVRRLLGSARNSPGRRAPQFLSPVLLSVLALGALLFIC